MPNKKFLQIAKFKRTKRKDLLKGKVCIENLEISLDCLAFVDYDGDSIREIRVLMPLDSEKKNPF